MSNSQSKFVKQILVEEGEYERLRQRQFKEYSPEIQTMVKLEQQIVEILARKDLDPQQKLDLISGLQERFNQLKEQTNTLTGLTAAKGAAAPDVDAGKAVPNKATPNQQPVTNGTVKKCNAARTDRSAAKGGQADGYYRKQPPNHSAQRFEQAGGEWPRRTEL